MPGVELMGHQTPTPLDKMVWRGCQFTVTEAEAATANSRYGPDYRWPVKAGTFGKHTEYTQGCFACHVASGGGDD